MDNWFLFIFSDIKEKEVKCLDSSLSPPEKVQLALDCLPKSSEETLDGTNSSFCRWTIMDYAKAYCSGDITPSMVFSSFNILLTCCHHVITLAWIKLYCFTLKNMLLHGHSLYGISVMIAWFTLTSPSHF